MIEVRGLTKRFGSVLAVDDLSFSVAPGAVTGFLGANGAGKSTTLRMVLGLDAPTAGTATVAGRRYRDLRRPAREVGALLDPRCAHPGRTARAHLRWMADLAGVGRARADEVLELAGVAAVAGRRIGALSLGQRQRVGLAGALLGDPGTLVLDEPLNGLDPAGVAWLRGLLRDLAAQGRTVLVSSHLLHEMEHTAQRVVVLARGRLVAERAVADLRAASVLVRAVDPPGTARLGDALHRAGARVTAVPDGLEVRGRDAGEVGRAALAHGVALAELSVRSTGLEESFLALTGSPS